MANTCFYEIKVTGRKNDVDRVFEVLRNENNQERLIRQDLVSMDDVDRVDIENNKIISREGYGECAWSLACSLCIDECQEGTINLQQLSRKYNVVIEAMSEECGMEFCEHYLFDKGDTVMDETYDYQEIELDDEDLTLGDFNKMTEQELTQEEFDKLRSKESWYSYYGDPNRDFRDHFKYFK